LPDSMPTALPAPPVWWCKHAAYGIGLTLRHVTPEWELQANFWLPYANLLKKRPNRLGVSWIPQDMS
jgi:hypothetical protein